MPSLMMYVGRVQSYLNSPRLLNWSGLFATIAARGDDDDEDGDRDAAFSPAVHLFTSDGTSLRFWLIVFVPQMDVSMHSCACPTVSFSFSTLCISLTPRTLL